MITVAVSTAADPRELSEALTLSGALATLVEGGDAEGEWAVALVDLRSEPLQQLREARRISEDVGCPVMVVITSTQTTLLEHERWIADFITEPIDTL
ncbi:MAG: hypothetical protein OEX97_07820, partial [Acidimicrobiia bacterium]|nr:hypothetical protein [Acidimicrobiia bacterium]